MLSTNLVVLHLRQLRSRRLGFGLSVAVNTFALLKLLTSTDAKKGVSPGSEWRAHVRHVCLIPFWRWELRSQECEAETSQPSVWTGLRRLRTEQVTDDEGRKVRNHL